MYIAKHISLWQLLHPMPCMSSVPLIAIVSHCHHHEITIEFKQHENKFGESFRECLRVPGSLASKDFFQLLFSLNWERPTVPPILKQYYLLIDFPQGSRQSECEQRLPLFKGGSQMG